MRPGESFLEQPVRSLQTMLRVIAEDNNRYPSVVPDGIYGPSTTQAAVAFQRANGLPTNGIVDQLTWDMIAEQYESALVRIDKAEPIEILLEPGQVLRLGDSGAYIYLLQSILIYLSEDYLSITVPYHTGVFDNETSNALSDFQKLANLEQTGELDRETWKNLARHFTLKAHHDMRIESNPND